MNIKKKKKRTFLKMSQKQEIFDSLQKGAKTKEIMEKYGIGESTIVATSLVVEVS